MKTEFVAIVLAAGLGKRMKSDRPKALHPVYGRPMIDHVLDSLDGAGAKKIFVVVGHKGEMVREHLGKRAICVEQKERLGTGHAVLQAEAALNDFQGDVLIVNGDTPLLKAQTLRALADSRKEHGAPGVVLATRLDDPFGYGRIVRDALGRVTRIVEQRDATPQEAQLREINTGVYCVDRQILFQTLDKVDNNNAQGEYYLTDIVGILSEENRPILGLVAGDASEVVGVNSRPQLAFAEKLMRERILRQYMEDGLTVIDPETTYLEQGITFGRDVVVHPSTFIRGACEIGDEAEVGPGAEIRDSQIGPNARVRYSWVEKAEVGDDAIIGPYARINPGARVAPGSVVDSFSTVNK